MAASVSFVLYGFVQGRLCTAELDVWGAHHQRSQLVDQSTAWASPGNSDGLSSRSTGEALGSQ